MADTQQLLEIMAALRDPDHGCPWDLRQDFASIAPYTIEEAYEVADAIERGDLDELRGELGDLLFQVVFHARMAEEQGAFDYSDVVDAIVTKMVERHPHVFAGDEGGQKAWEPLEWERRKLRERDRNSVLDGIGAGLPELARAQKLQKRAATVGFDWPDAEGVFHKTGEELAELREAHAAGDAEGVADELGDLLFACVNLARHLEIDPGRALRGANGKFERRFRKLEDLAREQGRVLEEMPLEELERLWRRAKHAAGPSSP